MSDLVIRQIRDDEVEVAARCLSAAFAPYRERYTVLAYADTVLDAAGLRERMKSMRVLVASSDGQIVGTVAGGVHGKEGHLRGMAVLPAMKGSGIAVQLLTAIERWLREQGCTRISLDTTLPLEAAIRFYEKHGYVRSGKVADFFGMALIEYVKRLD